MLASVALVLLASGVACETASPDPTNESNTLLSEAIDFEGKITGQVFESQSTRTSIADDSAAQTAPLSFATGGAVVRFQDIAGADLLDVNGNPIPPAPLGEDGTFTADNLPVGTDFNVCVDIAGNDRCDVASCVNIPADSNGLGGQLNGARVDPLTTIVLEKLRELMRARGLRPRDLPISPVAVVRRIVDAYTHLFEESGIDQAITLDELANLSPDELGVLFDTIIPAGARSGMLIVEGNLDLAQSEDAEARARAAAEVFLRAGFPIVDRPGGLDLSALANLEGVESAPISELFGNGPRFDDFEESADLGEDFFDEFTDLAPAENTGEPIVYFDTTTEPDRNFGNADGAGEEGPEGVPHLPMIADRVLLKMARIDLRGGRVTLAQLHNVLTSLDRGLGARLTHEIRDPNFAGPPLTVFQTEDGRGKALNLERIFRRIFEAGLNRQNDDSLDRPNAELHRLMAELLGDTIAPSFNRLFGHIVDERIGGIEDLSNRVRNARAHLPFNRSGPEAFFMVADADPFDPERVASAVTVNAEVDLDGKITGATYDATGEGRFYLGFTGRTEENGVVEFVVRETGRRLHGPRGPIRRSMHNRDIFADINGVSFFDFVSQSGRFFPGIDIAVRRADFAPPSGEAFSDPDANNVDPNDVEPVDSVLDDRESTVAGEPAPAELEERDVLRIFVLATRFGSDAEPVRVNYNRETGDATHDPHGRYLLMFTPDTEATGEFVLFNERAGREARLEDPTAFFDATPTLPDGFEDIFNEFEDDPNNEEFDQFLDEFPLDDIDTNAAPDDIVDNTDPVDEPDGIPADTNGVAPAEFIDDTGRILVTAREIIGLRVDLQQFTRVFGTDVLNVRYDADADPFYDDINDNDVQDAGEPTVSFRPLLFDPRDWRATDIASYYRRANNHEPVDFDEVDFEADTPRALDGVELLPRNYKPRLNAFRFGRPNTAINLLTAFLPPEFFDGTRALNADTRVDIFTAVALVNLVMDQVFNVRAEVDVDGFGPLPRRRLLIDAHLFIVPLDDPFVVLMRSIGERAQINNRAP